jgi:hypothetical protein
LEGGGRVRGGDHENTIAWKVAELFTDDKGLSATEKWCEDDGIVCGGVEAI